MRGETEAGGSGDGGRIRGEREARGRGESEGREAGGRGAGGRREKGERPKGWGATKLKGEARPGLAKGREETLYSNYVAKADRQAHNQIQTQKNRTEMPQTEST